MSIDDLQPMWIGKLFPMIETFVAGDGTEYDQARLYICTDIIDGAIHATDVASGCRRVFGVLVNPTD